MTEKNFKFSFAEQDLVIELGQMANLSAQAVTLRYGDTVVLTTVNYNDNSINQDFFPLTVVFQEKLYSIGRIPGGFLKREGFPGEYATLCARLIDRSIRPLFPEGFNYEVQVVNNVLALSEDCDVRFVSAFATSLALALSGLPFQGPTATVVVGRINNQWIINPSKQQLIDSELELIVGGTVDAINMIEASAAEIAEADLLEAIELAHTKIKSLIGFQTEVIKAINNPKVELPLLLIPDEIASFLKNYQPQVDELSKITDKKGRSNKFKTIFELAKTAFFSANPTWITDGAKEAETLKFIHNGLEDLLKVTMREMILSTNHRIDGRKINQIRPLSSKIDILPIVHGSAIFNRGETQVLSIVTLGALAEHQIIDDLGKDDSKRFMHHYNFPPFSVGETGRMGKPSRREVGHGALGEKALLQMIPNEQDFPYTIRIVSEVLSSNGSTSQAAICASSLALMAAGVPTKAPIAGIAMGLIKAKDQYVVLTDIQGLEDHLGDMDFKVAGTTKGICALQMDIKISGLDFKILSEALQQAQVGRLAILDSMNQVIDKPRTQLAANAPKILQKQVPVDKIREIIGTGGKVINKIISQANNVKIDIEEDGRILIYHQDQAAVEAAWKLIDEIINVKPIQVGDEFAGSVIKILNFGAFINLKNNTDGLIHISQFSKFFEKKIENLNDVVKVSDNFNVKVAKINDKGKIDLEIIK
ncbi:polyribonucleotide nucleotidyltransferase [Spiroplasma platyhelix]|uniref:Polyribonucleotide nucleotidyltransferase n=1 Tax=Spiroplasma platyhelix PALS-1 TaxID=1276218 RepID=A0A846TS56_9MOLU|nr:polyribonucleotide nucleotidyltransferase [Spiroplasma platyhelix]MBE4703962.1 Polyribonucleotide nucleotidyltransferase [Spiroplasma platyhelix PALS-1]NKE38335.1 polyribonucleotide nucleotidyltransferase [Spiroplasma platyhelix PALS-1]UJB29220.1 polyribonucleotide nucleotidyltransferase [Spiroplasma platyhelix PALS-1]